MYLFASIVSSKWMNHRRNKSIQKYLKEMRLMKYVAIEYLQAGLLQLVFCLQLNFLNIALLFKVGAKLVPKNYFFTLPKPHWITSSRTSNTKNKCKDPAKSPPTLPLAIRCTCARRYIIWRRRTWPLRLNYPSQDRAARLLFIPVVRSHSPAHTPRCRRISSFNY